MKKPVIGVLALQGDFEAHQGMLDRIDVPNIQVRLPDDLQIVQGLIIPGGESTTLIKLIQAFDLAEPIRRFAAEGGAVYGTCAGAILVAAAVEHNRQFSFGLIDITVSRNGYGRQADSFERNIHFTGLESATYHAVFIRAPKIVEAGIHVTVLATLDETIIAARQDRVLVTTFHPELTDDPRIHEYFVNEFVKP